MLGFALLFLGAYVLVIMIPGIKAMASGKMAGNQLYDFVFKLFVPIGLLLFGGLQFDSASERPQPPVEKEKVPQQHGHLPAHRRGNAHQGLLQVVNYEQKKPIFVVVYPWLILILPVYIFALNANQYLEETGVSTISYLVSYFVMYLPVSLLLCVVSYLNDQKYVYMACNTVVTLLFLPFLFPKFVLKLFHQ